MFEYTVKREVPIHIVVTVAALLGKMDGQRITATKLVRDELGVSLKVAVDIVNEIKATIDWSAPYLSDSVA